MPLASSLACNNSHTLLSKKYFNPGQYLQGHSEDPRLGHDFIVKWYSAEPEMFKNLGVFTVQS